MNNDASDNEELVSTPWDSLYSGGVDDYRAPEIDIIEAAAELNIGEALDIGCGAGGLCVELDRRGWTVKGIDITSKAIAAARRIAAERNSDAIFETADATMWRPKQSYDLVINNFGLPPQSVHRTAVYAMMREAVTVGGVVLIKIWDHSGEHPSTSLVGYESLNIEELKRGFSDFEILKEKFVDSPVHAHGGHEHAQASRRAILFMARKLAA